jgi:pyruvate,water dikinase
MSDARKQMDYYLEYTPKWYSEALVKIETAENEAQLDEVWRTDVRPFLSELWRIWFGGAGSLTLVSLRRTLAKMVSEEQANLLCSNFSGSGTLVSLQPMLAIESVMDGMLSREEYIELYGHRSPNEFDVSYPYPADDPDFIEKQIEQYKTLDISPSEMMKKQREEFEKAREAFGIKYPKRKSWLDKKLARISSAASRRESLRNEFVKIFRTMRKLLLKTSELTGIGDDIFMLYSFELSPFLQGDRTAAEKFPARRKSFEHYKTLPIFPPFIRGRFIPEQWLRDKNRRSDYFDPNVNEAEQYYESGVPGDEGVIKGFAGAPGIVEGTVRVLHSFDQFEEFQKGEILVTTMTNIGWTPLFPKAAAIVTDLGAPLSHAAIVAREMGIPAVVGTGNATTAIKTGDKISVNGSNGRVKKLL